MSVQVLAIKKDGGNHYNPHKAIQEFYWKNEQTGTSDYSSQKQMQEFLIAYPQQAYVKDKNNDIVTLFVKNPGTIHAYVTTYPDGIKADNLLNLPEY